MIGLAVLGFGVVGSGVVEVIRKGSENISKKAGDQLAIKYILDVRDFSGHPESSIITKDPETIFNDSGVGIIVETIGGVGAAYEFTKRALMSGRHVVTSNKELVAVHGPELLQTARDNNVSYMFEASVGGGIPVIKPIYECLTANEITSITGILNGTTNYILTSMAKEGRNFADALKEAQKKGYAEANPTADIEGYDSCRKIAILLSMALEKYINYKNIPTEGIADIKYEDLKIAESIDCKIKLIAYSKLKNGRISARVCPALIESTHTLAGVDGVFNAILISGDAIGDVMFYGKGAGKLPTASAVVGDIIDIARNIDRVRAATWEVEPMDKLINPESEEAGYFIRVKVENEYEAKRLITEKFGDVEFLNLTGFKGQLAFRTSKGKDIDIRNNIESIKENKSVLEVLTALRILD